jgi:ABC-type nitrate/sulfonate/bicarbonate transport system permease component
VTITSDDRLARPRHREMRYGQFNALCRELREAMDCAQHDRAHQFLPCCCSPCSPAGKPIAGWRRAGADRAAALRRAGDLWSEIASGRLLPHLRITATEMALGLALGCIGRARDRHPAGGIRRCAACCMPYIVASQVVPKLALGPLFIIWFGFGMTSTVVITALICFFPLMENTMTGLRQVDPARRELFRMLGASRLQTLLRLKLPSALPVIMAGLRVAVVLALVGAVVGEFIGGRAGSAPRSSPPRA